MYIISYNHSMQVQFGYPFSEGDIEAQRSEAIVAECTLSTQVGLIPITINFSWCPMSLAKFNFMCVGNIMSQSFFFFFNIFTCHFILIRIYDSQSNGVLLYTQKKNESQRRLDGSVVEGSAFGSGHDPGLLGSSPTSGSPQGICLSLCLCLCLSICISH